MEYYINLGPDEFDPEAEVEAVHSDEVKEALHESIMDILGEMEIMQETLRLVDQIQEYLTPDEHLFCSDSNVWFILDAETEEVMGESDDLGHLYTALRRARG